MICWHCQNTNLCNCPECGSYALVAGTAGWTAGKCQVCKAVAFHTKHRSILQSHDTMDRKNWEFHAPADGNKGYRVFIPLKGLQ